MEVRFTFGAEAGPISINLLASKLFSLQDFWRQLAFLSMDRREHAGQDVPSMLIDTILSNGYLEILDVRRDYFFLPASLDVRRISYQSPLKIDGTSSLTSALEAAPGRIKQTFRMLQHLFALDAYRQRAFHEADLARQHVIEAQLRNLEHAIDLSEKIESADLREEFIRRMSKTISSLSDVSLRLENVEVRQESKELAKGDPYP